MVLHIYIKVVMLLNLSVWMCHISLTKQSKITCHTVFPLVKIHEEAKQETRCKTTYVFSYGMYYFELRFGLRFLFV